MTKERARLDFKVSDIVVDPDRIRAPVRPGAAELIRLVVADLPKSHLHTDEVISFVRSNYPNAQVMFVAGPGAAAVDISAACTTAVNAESGVNAGTVTSETSVLEAEAAEIGRRFSPRQAQVAVHLVKGLSNKEIARKLDLSESTVKVHVVSIFRALDVHSRARAVSAILSSAALQRELGL